MAPEVGFEPTTNRLTADRSTTELLRILLDGRRNLTARRPLASKNRTAHVIYFLIMSSAFLVRHSATHYGIGVSSFPRAVRKIVAAKQPAPKPLSMFMTATFGAQELSIPSKAASPPKEAP